MSKILNNYEKALVFSEKETDLSNAVRVHTKAVENIGKIASVLSRLHKVAKEISFTSPKDLAIHNDKVLHQVGLLNTAIASYNKLSMNIRSMPFLLTQEQRNGLVTIVEFPGSLNN